jgi:hypothetical protein
MLAPYASRGLAQVAPTESVYPEGRSLGKNPMIESLVQLLIAILVIGLVAAVITYCIDLLPIDPRFRQIAKALVLIIAVLVILVRALPLLGMHTG